MKPEDDHKPPKFPPSSCFINWTIGRIDEVRTTRMMRASGLEQSVDPAIWQRIVAAMNERMTATLANLLQGPAEQQAQQPAAPPALTVAGLQAVIEQVWQPLVIRIWVVDQPEMVGLMRSLLEQSERADTLPGAGIALREFSFRHATSAEIARTPFFIGHPGIYLEWNTGYVQRLIIKRKG